MRQGWLRSASVQDSGRAMRIAFMGTPAFAVPALDALITAGHDIAAVYTQPPRAAHRGRTLTKSPVHRRAEALGLEIRTPETLKAQEDRDAFASLDLDVAIVAAYGLLLPVPVLEAPRHGCINIHASLLPRWRGAAPIQRAILAGDVETGITIMQMERGLDTGPMLAMRATPVDRKTAGSLTEELANIGGGLIVDVLSRLDDIRAVLQPEDGVTYAKKIDKGEARLDFCLSAVEVERAVRAFNPSPGAFTELAGERLKILAAEIVDGSGEPGCIIDERLTIACDEGAIRPIIVQRAGKAPMDTQSMLRGLPVTPGSKLA